MKPFFIYDSFEIRTEHQDLTELIKNIINDFRQRKKIQAGLSRSPIISPGKRCKFFSSDHFMLHSSEEDNHHLGERN